MTETINPLPEAPYQISDKIDQAIFLVRGTDIQQTVDDYLVLKDILKAALPAAPAASQVRAGQVVGQVGGNTQVVSDAEMCQHGPREYKSGTKKNGGGSWSGWFCAKKICDVSWAKD